MKFISVSQSHLVSISLSLLLHHVSCCMGGAENAILFLLSFKSEKQDVAYGQAKADAFQYLSWDNRLRYCYFHTVMCMIGRLGSVPGRNKIMEPRLQKVRKILQAVSMKAPPENLVFMDTDVVLADASTNIFEDDFFTNGMIDGERLGITMDLNYTFATRNNLPTDTQRYQTGVLFLRTTNGQSVHALLRNLLNLSKTLVRDVHSGETRSHNLSSHSLKDGDRRFSDQWLLNELVHQQPQYASIIDILQPRHVFNAFPVYEESWYSVSVQTNGSLPINVGHARPQQSSVSSYWNQLGLPRGDEIKGKSVVVHFAGIFGGASATTGTTDATVLLLALHGFIARHLDFVGQLISMELKNWTRTTQPSAARAPNRQPFAEKQRDRCLRCSIVSNDNARSILQQMLAYAENCIHTAFSVDIYVQERQEKLVVQCIGEINQRSMLLFSNASKTLQQVKQWKVPIMRCCSS